MSGYVIGIDPGRLGGDEMVVAEVKDGCVVKIIYRGKGYDQPPPVRLLTVDDIDLPDVPLAQRGFGV